MIWHPVRARGRARCHGSITSVAGAEVACAQRLAFDQQSVVDARGRAHAGEAWRQRTLRFALA